MQLGKGEDFLHAFYGYRIFIANAHMKRYEFKLLMQMKIIKFSREIAVVQSAKLVLICFSNKV